MLATQQQFDKAKSLILRELEKGPQTRQKLGQFAMWGIPRACIDLALYVLRQEGTIEELYTLPREGKGQRPHYWVLTTTPEQLMPSDAVRMSDALHMIAQELPVVPAWSEQEEWEKARLK